MTIELWGNWQCTSSEGNSCTVVAGVCFEFNEPSSTAGIVSAPSCGEYSFVLFSESRCSAGGSPNSSFLHESNATGLCFSNSSKIPPTTLALAGFLCSVLSSILPLDYSTTASSSFSPSSSASSDFNPGIATTLFSTLVQVLTGKTHTYYTTISVL